ncbi:MAG TPA: nucleoside deaminase [Hanamia sp.]|nr:nucleoside deaminase [Hanamia sp.]
MKPDTYYMQRCETLGKTAAKKGNPPVGALIVKNDVIISESEEAGKTKNDITCHAEIEAVRIAVRKLRTSDLSECILFTTHEPCIMCSYVIRFYKIKKVVYKNKVDFLGSISSSMPLLISSDVPPHWSKPPEIFHLPSENE